MAAVVADPARDVQSVREVRGIWNDAKGIGPPIRRAQVWAWTAGPRRAARVVVPQGNVGCALCIHEAAQVSATDAPPRGVVDGVGRGSIRGGGATRGRPDEMGNLSHP